VIIPFEHLDNVDLSNYEDGYVVRLTAVQADSLSDAKQLDWSNRRFAFEAQGRETQAFVLYRSSEDLELFKIRRGWIPCEHWARGSVSNKRTQDGEDRGHFLVRIPREASSGIAQGIFAPEYTTRELNYICQLELTYLAYLTLEHLKDQSFEQIRTILETIGWDLTPSWNSSGVLKDGTSSCPLCLRPIHRDELHQTIDPSLVPGLANSGVQLAETRSTLINLFHLRPLLYDKQLGHHPTNVAWGHAHCNTFLGQRAAFGWDELGSTLDRASFRTNDEGDFIRSDDGRAWISVTPLPPGSSSFSEAFGTPGSISDEEEED
jgi:hypothetical protein